MNLRYFCLFLVILANFGSIMANDIDKTNQFNKLWPAICKIESNNNYKAVGDNGLAVGIAQIHTNCLKDSNKYGKTDFTPDDRFDPIKSKIICFNYLKRYQKSHNWELEGMAKTWNGGPGWQKNAKKNGQTAKNLQTYWNKIQKEVK